MVILLILTLFGDRGIGNIEEGIGSGFRVTGINGPSLMQFGSPDTGNQGDAVGFGFQGDGSIADLPGVRHRIKYFQIFIASEFSFCEGNACLV